MINHPILYTKQNVRIKIAFHLEPGRRVVFTKETLQKIADQGTIHGEMVVGNALPFGRHSINEASTTVAAEHVTHRFVDLRVEHGALYGDLEIFDTPAGRKVKEQLAQVFWSFRGIMGRMQSGVADMATVIAVDAAIPPDIDWRKLDA